MYFHERCWAGATFALLTQSFGKLHAGVFLGGRPPPHLKRLLLGYYETKMLEYDSKKKGLFTNT